MTIANNPLFLSQILNPALAGLIDATAALLSPDQAKGNGLGVPTKTTAPKATATATAKAGGATATATASAGGAQGAGRALGLNVGEAVGEQVKGAISNFAQGFVEGFVDGLASAFTPEAPSPADNCGCKQGPGKVGSLKTDQATSTVETAGGYKIQMTGQFEWTITGPDGKSTRIWGDPHVETKGKDGKIEEKWDFKKDSTFVLPDGTKLNVVCSPWGNDMTVTSKIEILHGNDRVVITDIDKGKGKIGEVKQGEVEQFKTNQTFVAGSNVADWHFDGHEVLANINGKADTFKLGGPVYDVITSAAKAVGVYGGDYGNGAGMDKTWLTGQERKDVRFFGEEQRNTKLDAVLQQLLPLLTKLTDLLKLTQSHNAYRTPQPEPAKQTQAKPYDPNEHRQGLSNALRAVGSMFQVLASLIDMVGALKNTARAPQTA